MKKFVFASVLAMVSMSLAYTPALHAQDSITIKDPAEFNAYQTASTQSDPKAKAVALESFLQTFPQSVVKNAVLDTLIDTYQSLGDADKTLSAASRLLQVDPNNMKTFRCGSQMPSPTSQLNFSRLTIASRKSRSRSF